MFRLSDNLGDWAPVIMQLMCLALMIVLFFLIAVKKAAELDNLEEQKKEKKLNSITDIPVKDHPLFKLTMDEIELYITVKFTKKLVAVVDSDISVNDPDKYITLFTLAIVKFNDDIIGMRPLFDKYFGPNYIESFTENLFNDLKRDGTIAKMIDRHGLM